MSISKYFFQNVKIKTLNLTKIFNVQMIFVYVYSVVNCLLQTVTKINSHNKMNVDEQMAIKNEAILQEAIFELHYM